MTKKHLPTLLTILLPLLAGCAGGNLDMPALVVEIRDARTGAPAAYDATVITVRDGISADTVRVWMIAPPEFRTQAVLAGSRDNRPGMYDVTITHPEYQTWHRTGIRVEKKENNPFGAGVIPRQVHILAELQPLDGG
jgi:esterase/lipase superfamily enzyme